MISTEQALKYLDSKEKITLTEKSFSSFSKKYKTLGLIISSNYVTKGNHYPDWRKVYVETFGDDVTLNPWESTEGKKLAIHLFGEIRASYIADIWRLIDTLPYQVGYQRRSFRRKADIEFARTKIEALCNICHAGMNTGFSTLPIAEQIQYDVYSNYYGHAYLFAAALNQDGEKYEALISDIINGEDDIGGTSRQIIKALLITKKPSNWEQVDKLLLAAQRQEGLRQTILECLDETDVGALAYMIKVILENDLSRFSSVVRAVDTWFGFGWEAPKKTTIKRTLSLASEFLENPHQIDQALESKDFLEVYVALWALAVNDVTMANQAAFKLLYEKPDKDSKLLALFFISETGRTQSDLVAYFEKEVGKDIELDYWMLLNMPKYEMSDTLFEKIKTCAESLPTKGKSFESRVFSWKNYTVQPSFFYQKLIDKSNDQQLESLSQDISLLPSEMRSNYIRKLFPKHFTYSWYGYDNQQKKVKAFKEAGWKRNVAYQAIKDRNESVMATGIKLFQSMDLKENEIDLLQDLLSRKHKSLRKNCIQILLSKSNLVLEKSISELISSKNIDQRLAGLEILTTLDATIDKTENPGFVTFFNEHIEEYSKRANLNKNEQVFLDKGNITENEFSFSNGFGVIDYDNLTPLVTPEKKFTNKKSLLKAVIGKKQTLISQFVNEAKTVKEINKLIDILKENKNHEYQYEGYKGETVTALLSDWIQPTKKLEKATALKRLEVLPLAQVWIDWYQQSKLSDIEMEAASSFFINTYHPYGFYEGLVPFLKNYISNLEKINVSIDYQQLWVGRNLSTILKALINAFCNLEKLTIFKMDLLEDAIASFPDDLKDKNLDKNKWRQDDVYWCDALLNNQSLTQYTYSSNLEKSMRMWHFNRYMMAQSLGHPEKITKLKDALNIKRSKQQSPRTSEEQTIPLYHQGMATKDDVLLEALFSSYGVFTLDCDTDKKPKKIEKLNPPFEIFKPLKKNLLDIEIERGELATEATHYIERLRCVEGMEYLFTVLERMGKANFERGYSYDSSSKASTFSNIIKKCEPNKSDTYERFSTRLDTLKFTKKRLIEVACYSTKWADWIGQYLQQEDLESAVWWFHAHSSEYMNAQKETVISRYSNVPIHDFEKGSLDVDWFQKVYQSLGKTNWKLLHDASKYISYGMAHKQVKLYSGVLLGEIKITATLKKIKEKRDKDYVRALGLIPLSKTNPDADVLKRYNLLQTFLKESKQFGAQRQESEKNAVEIGIENLSRNAGYRDSIRFSWAMESKAAQEIMQQSTVSIDEIVVSLLVNEDGKAQLDVEKNGKSQKTIPKKYQKNKDILRLKENKTYLTKQYSRTRLSLENAMINEDIFSAKELEYIMQHPVVKPMLSKIVLIDIDQTVSGFWHEGKLIDAENKTHDLKHEQQLLIVHPSHLFKIKQWSHYQRYLFENEIVQPFKQVFRELYLVTDDEKETSNRSQRYQGHQVQPKKTIALLRGRGWTVNYEEGLQKVYHKEGFVASIYAMADWFSPADIEAPTLEYVAFTELKKHDYMPLADINPLIFSEVMRDVDLVVSVAHVGGVDPEASHSSMQMRAALAIESARLFKLDNIEVKDRHILVKGKLGDYNIHLGSANVKKDGLSLSIIPVHSQHRGRLFLPFIDDDPKSAEIIAKMKLLAEDDKIQDPTVLAQINKH